MIFSSLKNKSFELLKLKRQLIFYYVCYLYKNLKKFIWLLYCKFVFYLLTKLKHSCRFWKINQIVLLFVYSSKKNYKNKKLCLGLIKFLFNKTTKIMSKMYYLSHLYVSFVLDWSVQFYVCYFLLVFEMNLYFNWQ